MIKCKKCGAEDSIIAEFESRDYGIAKVTKIPFEFPKDISWTSGDEVDERGFQCFECNESSEYLDELAEEVIKSEE